MLAVSVVVESTPGYTVVEVNRCFRCIEIYEIVHLVGEGTYGEVFKSVLKSQMSSFVGGDFESATVDEKQNAINNPAPNIHRIKSKVLGGGV